LVVAENAAAKRLVLDEDLDVRHVLAQLRRNVVERGLNELLEVDLIAHTVIVPFTFRGVRALPEGFEVDALIDSLSEGWGIEVATIEYAPLGGGSYHWVADDLFVTVDDLDRKPWLGDTRDAAFEGLRRAFDTAVALQGNGLEFVLAPIPTISGESLHRVDARYTAAVFPFVDGQPGVFGEYEEPDRKAVLALIDELRRATPAVASIAPVFDPDLPGRAELEQALTEVGEPWTSGPFAEPARAALAAHASEMTELLDLMQRLAGELVGQDEWVVTHGEPHGGNVIRTASGRVLVDWDTVAIAPRERDLWWLVTADTHDADPVALDYFRLRWDLADLASFLTFLRAPHRENVDTAKAYEGVRYCVTMRSKWTALLD
jgi:spectinomycin phosphotransferase